MSRRFLLLEDNALNRELFGVYLETLGYAQPDVVTTIAEFEACIPKILAGAYDLVVMDIMLPDGESIPCAERISRACSVPCMAYTARSNPQ